MDDIKVYNFKKLLSNLYFIRTQAGFKRAVDEWSGREKGEHRLQLSRYPKNYPCMVSLSFGYRGYDYIEVLVVPFKKMEKFSNDILEVINEDKLIRNKLTKNNK